MSPPMHIGRAWADRIGDVYWPLVYGFNIFVCVVQIIASEITNNYGGMIFGSSANKNGAMTQNPDDEGGQVNYVERDHAMARTGVVSSIGIAIGSVNLILTIGSFIAYKFLDYQRTSKNSRKDYDQRFILVVVVSILSFILFCGNIALTVGYVLTSHFVKLWTPVESSSSTPEHLIAAGVMAALSAVMLLATMIVDNRKLASHRRFIEEDEQERMIADPEADGRREK